MRATVLNQKELAFRTNQQQVVTCNLNTATVAVTQTFNVFEGMKVFEHTGNREPKSAEIESESAPASNPAINTIPEAGNNYLQSWRTTRNGNKMAGFADSPMKRPNSCHNANFQFRTLVTTASISIRFGTYHGQFGSIAANLHKPEAAMTLLAQPRKAHLQPGLTEHSGNAILMKNLLTTFGLL